MNKKTNICGCGCGNLCEKNYLKGHGRRGKKNTVGHNIKIAHANKNRIRTEVEKERMRISSLGRKCSEKTKTLMSKIAKERGFGKWMKGRKLSEEAILKLKIVNTGHTTSEKTRKKISKANSRKNNGMYGKTHSDEYRKILSDNAINLRKNAHTPEAIEKRRLKAVGKKASVETKQKMRIAKIKYIENKNGGVCTMHNISACKYFDELSKTKKWNLQHALNGGEYHISKLGYFVDAYDAKKNIVVEYDESLHYDRNGVLKNKDIIRQNEIINYLKCQFFRFNEKKGELYEI